jgi:hypothetical protein
MKEILPASKSIPAWQMEQARKIHRACLCVQAAAARGEKISKYIRRTARRYNGRKLKSDSERLLQLSAQTLRRHFGVWKRGGQVAAALLPRYTPRRSVFTAPILIRFVNFITSRPQPSMQEAWREFAKRGGNFGPGRRAGKPLKITYGQLQYSFPAAKFYLLRAQEKAMETAQANADALQQKFIAEICERFPARPPRRRVKRETDFQI